jgi:hypothetical protein
MALLHTALLVCLPEGRFVVETMWPSPDTNLAARGVVLQGDVGGRLLGLIPWLRYEVRCWRDGILPDAAKAIGGPHAISHDDGVARRLLHEAKRVPALVWGRDQMATGEMWNSNSVISWLLARAGIESDQLHPPAGGRAPGWNAGLVVARRQMR